MYLHVYGWIRNYSFIENDHKSQNSSCMVVLSTRAMPVVFGLNMETADTVIVFDSDWASHKWTSMPHRIGMNKEVRVF